MTDKYQRIRDALAMGPTPGAIGVGPCPACRASQLGVYSNLTAATKSDAERLGEREYMDEIMCDVPGLAAAIWEEREREAFENWFSDDWQHPKAVERDAIGYKLAAAQNAWTAWQAGWRAALASQQQEGTANG